jgi:hypothetical protein
MRLRRRLDGRAAERIVTRPAGYAIEVSGGELDAFEGDLHEGRHEQLIGELVELIAQHPLREHFHGQLMLAQSRNGRPAEALAACQRARNVLAAGLGVEPGPELRDLHQRILSADPALAVTGPTRIVAAESREVVPQELPQAA